MGHDAWIQPTYTVFRIPHVYVYICMCTKYQNLVPRQGKKCRIIMYSKHQWSNKIGGTGITFKISLILEENKGVIKIQSLKWN